METTSETNVVVITITGSRLNKNNGFLLTVQVIRLHLKTLICTTEMQSTGTGGITEVHPADVDEHPVVVTEDEITISTGMEDTMNTETVVMMITMVARDLLQ